jgi:hypothetical protein
VTWDAERSKRIIQLRETMTESETIEDADAAASSQSGEGAYRNVFVSGD